MQRIFVLMFHRIFDPLQCDKLARFERFLSNLVEKYTVVLPCDPLPTQKPPICLTFDDAYYDFYHYVFPLLKKYNIKALLAVPVQAIPDGTPLSATERLANTDTHTTSATYEHPRMPLCTWAELIEMARSEHVELASHGYQHADLTCPRTNFQQEVVLSKQILEEKIQQPVSTFVYPYGRMNSQIHRTVRKHYQYGFRIGNAFNYGWDHQEGLVYRIDADPFWKTNKKLRAPHTQIKLLLKNWSNRFRSR